MEHTIEEYPSFGYFQLMGKFLGSISAQAPNVLHALQMPQELLRMCVLSQLTCCSSRG